MCQLSRGLQFSISDDPWFTTSTTRAARTNTSLLTHRTPLGTPLSHLCPCGLRSFGDTEHRYTHAPPQCGRKELVFAAAGP